MAGQKSQQHPPDYYTPTTKPNHAAASSWWRKLSILPIIIFTLLCILSYSIGRWHNASSTASATITVSSTSCTTATHNPNSVKIDFSSHHSANDADTLAVSGDGAAINEYPSCGISYSEYTPCEDQKRSLKYERDRLIYRERHCPEKKELLKCRVPAPYGYRTPFKWPKSRDLVWYANVPHKELTVEKAVQNWIRFEGDRFRFPGGGTMFPNGADKYIDDIGKLINFKDGSIRTAIDTGCGVASWGAYLMSRDILPLSFAPRDTHVSQVQFALERGVPALIGVLASKRLPYPSRAFDMAHCSRCLIPWGEYGGVNLMEVDRVLRPGGFWILSGPPIRWNKYWKGWERTKEDLNAEQTAIENVAKSLCWKKFVEKDDIAIWQKPYNHVQCKANRNIDQTTPFCPVQDPDKAWYTHLEKCLTPLPKVSDNQEVAGGGLENWPARLHAIPPRISRGTVEGVTTEDFKQNNKLWEKRVSYYKTVNNQLGKKGRYRNVLDMNAYLGGFAAALVKDPLWVMNVVPVEAKINTLGVVFERGLIGTYQSWCQAMSTYPRTYDLIHGDSVFTLYKNKCDMEDILLEMDRILRPEGSVILRDDVDTLVKVKRITDALKWESQIVDHEDGPMEREKLLFAVKSYWTAPADEGSQSSNRTTTTT